MKGRKSSLRYLMTVFFTLSFLAGSYAAGDTLTISGQVRNAYSKAPIAAAQITVANHPFSSTTDDQGNFTIKITSSSALLIVKAYDFLEKEVPVRGRKEVTINMYSDRFYNFFDKKEGVDGEKRASEIITANKNVSGINSFAAITPDEMIENELAGEVRSIHRSGQAATGASLFIRGLNSVNANAQPLFVVDGVIYNNLYDAPSIHKGFFSNSLFDIDNNDIESITVLKDGTSIYGAKASNGVILINTKRGKDMTTSIDLKAFYGWSEKPKTVPTMGVDDYRTYLTEILGTQKNVSAAQVSRYEFLNSDPSRPSYNKYHNNTNWDDEVYQNGNTQNYFLNVNGGDEKALYNFSLGYTSNDGALKTTDMNRINTRFNADINLTSFLKLGWNVGFANIQRYMLDDGVDEKTSVTYLSKIKSPFLSPYSYTSTGIKTQVYDRGDEFGISNPSAVIENSINKLKQYRFNLGIHPVIDINKNWKVETVFDYSLNKTKEDFRAPRKGLSSFIYYSDNGTPLGVIQDYISSQAMRDVAIFDDSRLTFTDKFGNNNITAYLGWRYLSNFYEADFVQGHNGGENATKVGDATEFRQVDGINNSTKYISTYAAADYAYAGKYFLSVAASMDASSRFGKKTEGGVKLFGTNWGLFPSVNAGWLISSEKFMKSLNFVNMMKVRAGYSVTGNDGIEDYASRAYFSSIRFLDRLNGTVLTNIANPKLQWETTYRKSAGIDLSIFDERLSVSADIYDSKTKDLLVMKELPQHTGLDYYWTNDGEMSNKGFEISANAKILNVNKLRFDVSASIGKYKNEITNLSGNEYITEVYGAEILTKVGHAAGVFYGYKTDGVYSTSEEAKKDNLKILEKNGSFSYFGAGDMKFIDQDGNGTINEKDKVVIGDPNPDFYGSFSGRLAYGNLTLSALFTYSYGNDIYNYYRSTLESGLNTYNQSNAMVTRWTSEGQTTSIPRAHYEDPMGNARFSDRWIEDGSYLKLKMVQLSYELPVKPKFLSGITIWGSCNNVWTWTKYLGLDPEVSAGNSVLYQGIDNGLLPQTRSYYIGVKINL